MTDRRLSGRLRKRARISYAPPADNDFDQDTEGADAAGELGGNADDGGDIDESDSEDDPSFDKRKKRKRRAKGEKRRKKKHKSSCSKSEAINKRHVFPWEELPSEMRNMIYQDCLTTGSTIILFYTKRKGRHYVRARGSPLGFALNLLLVNKATHAEGGSILYGQHFFFEWCISMYIFLATLSPTPKTWLRKVTLEPWERSHRKMGAAFLLPAFNALIGTTNLKRFQLGFGASHVPGSVRRLALEMYSYVYPWLGSVARQKGSMQEAVKLICMWETRLANPQLIHDRGLYGFYSDNAEPPVTSPSGRLQRELLQRLMRRF